MSDWLEHYTAALQERDAHEQAHKPYIDAYTRLADRTAATSNQHVTKASASPPTAEPSTSSKNKAPVSLVGRGNQRGSRDSMVATEPEPETTDVLKRLRSDLGSTQKARTALQAQVDDLTVSLRALEAQMKASTTQISGFARQKMDLERKVRDREEEIKGKSRLVIEAQDEMVALEMQLNMAEQRSDKLEGENRELLDRWMKRKGEEAESMNRDSRWE